MWETKVIFASAYFPGESNEPPPLEVVNLILYYKCRSLHVVIGCDSNAHHEAWGSSDTRTLEFLNSNSLVVANVGNKPSYRHDG